MANEPAFGFEIDPRKLDKQGREMLGELKAVARWCAMFGSMRDNSKDLTERVFLAEVIAALDEDGKRLSMVLTQHARKRGAVRAHRPETATSVPVVPDQTNEGPETKQ